LWGKTYRRKGRGGGGKKGKHVFETKGKKENMLVKGILNFIKPPKTPSIYVVLWVGGTPVSPKISCGGKKKRKDLRSFPSSLGPQFIRKKEKGGKTAPSFWNPLPRTVGVRNNSFHTL